MEFDIKKVVPGTKCDARGASNYWAKLKQRLKEEGADELLTNCQQLILKSPKDEKRYATDVANTEQILRIIQSVPSKKAEPLKLWNRKLVSQSLPVKMQVNLIMSSHR